MNHPNLQKESTDTFLKGSIGEGMNPDPHLIPSYHRGLAGFGVVLMDLKPGTKRPTRGWDDFDHWHQLRGKTRLDLLSTWLKKGGAMFRPAGGLWVLDCDDQETQERVDAWLKERGLSCPQIRTRSGGRHFYFRFPRGFNLGGIKAHVNGAGRKKWDFKLSNRTALVLPGTTTEKGPYLPIVPWVHPPEVDPHYLEPSIQIYRDSTPFLEYEGSKFRQRWGARNYLLCSRTKPSIAGKGGRKVLAEVACNLTRYYCQEPQNALAMLLRKDADGLNWNQRCQGEDGTPYPWSENELWDALMDSMDEVPSIGKHLWKMKERKQKAWESLERFLAKLERKPGFDGGPPCSRSYVHTFDLYWTFLVSEGLDDDPPFGVNAFSTFLMGSGFQIGRKKHLSAVLDVLL